jgi:hypothetical protein
MLVQGLGDIFLLVQSVKLLIETLHAAVRKAPKQVQGLLEDVAALERLIVAINSMVNEHGAVLKPHDDIKSGMVQILPRCGEMVEGLAQIASSYKIIVENEEEASEDESKANQWLRAMSSPRVLYLRVKWTTMENSIQKLRELLAQHMQALQTILQLLAASVQLLLREFFNFIIFR